VRESRRGVGRNPFENLLVEAGLHVVTVRRGGVDEIIKCFKSVEKESLFLKKSTF
jgi:predicted Fe-Mo cluster-binding NifX family protein